MNWLHMRNWPRFQHYKKRNPPWIKNYIEVLHDPEYRKLTGHERGVLHGLWLEYSASRQRLPLSCSELSARLALKVTESTLQKLKTAGFVEFSDSNSESKCARPETETETETEKNPPKPPRQEGGADAPKGRAIDHVWEALAVVFGEVAPGTSEHGARNKAVASIRRSLLFDEVDVEEAVSVVVERAAAWPQHFGEATLTDLALAKHWSTLSRPPRRSKSTTGWRFVRGSGSGTYIRDPDGVDVPPREYA